MFERLKPACGNQVAIRSAGAILMIAVAATLSAGSGEAAVPFGEGPLKRTTTKRPALEKLPRGPVQIVVSIDRQSVTLYLGGMFVARSAVSTGVHGHPTPTGVFTVLQKDKWHRSNIYSLAPMPYMQRITWSGVALHAGVLPGYPASHGCIRMSYDFAVRLWGITRRGARVIVARGDPAPAGIVHSTLFAPKAKVDPPPSVAANPERPVEPQAGPAKLGPANEPAVIQAAEAVKRDGSVEAPAAPAAAARRTGNVSVFVTRKAGKLFVRHNYMPLFDVPIALKDPARPLGTHVFTAMELTEDGTGMRWTAITMPSEAPKADASRPHGKKSRREERKVAIAPVTSKAAVEALDRIEIPPDAADRISELLTPGSSLIVSDQGISEETGDETDFIILAR